MEVTGLNYDAYEHNMYTRRIGEDSNKGDLRKPPKVAPSVLFG